MRRKLRLSKAPILGALFTSMWRFRVQHWQIRPAAWRGRPLLRIGIISDLHWGFAPMSGPKFSLIKKRLMATAPDIILFLGDLAGGYPGSAKQAKVAAGAAALKGLEAPGGCYAILGNHDWHDDPAAQARRGGPVAAVQHLKDAGFNVLQNEACKLRVRDDFWLCGLDSQQAIKGNSLFRKTRQGQDDLEQTLREAPGDEPVILLAHEPDIFPDIANSRVCLTLSGHTHAGQLRPFGRALYVPSRHGIKFAYGHHKDADRHLIVAAGLGCSTIPLRVGVTPEITVVDVS